MTSDASLQMTPICQTLPNVSICFTTYHSVVTPTTRLQKEKSRFPDDPLHKVRVLRHAPTRVLILPARREPTIHRLFSFCFSLSYYIIILSYSLFLGWTLSYCILAIEVSTTVPRPHQDDQYAPHRIALECLLAKIISHQSRIILGDSLSRRLTASCCLSSKPQLPRFHQPSPACRCQIRRGLSQEERIHGAPGHIGSTSARILE